jgi:hypothetical protein
MPVLKDVREGSASKNLQPIFKTSKITPDQLRSRLVDILDIVRVCSREIDFLSIALETKQFDKCPFFGEVWSGDAYGVTGEDGMKEVVKELDSVMVIVSSPEKFCNFILDD